MQAIILAGGRGTRLRPYTMTLPKPLVPVGDRPILDILLHQLKAAGVDEVVLSTGHLSDLIQAYCGDGSRWKLKLRYHREEKPLNTAGPLRLIEGLQDNFLVINGDILTSLKFEKIWKSHLETGRLATLGVCQRSIDIDFGVVEMTDENQLAAYKEKPKLHYYVSMGINVLHRRCLTFIKPDEPLGMPDLFLRLQAAGEKLLCYKSQDSWLDIGRPEDYQAAQDEFLNNPRTYLPDAP